MNTGNRNSNLKISKACKNLKRILPMVYVPDTISNCVNGVPDSIIFCCLSLRIESA